MPCVCKLGTCACSEANSLITVSIQSDPPNCKGEGRCLNPGLVTVTKEFHFVSAQAKFCTNSHVELVTSLIAWKGSTKAVLGFKEYVISAGQEGSNSCTGCNSVAPLHEVACCAGTLAGTGSVCVCVLIAGQSGIQGQHAEHINKFCSN